MNNNILHRSVPGFIALTIFVVLTACGPTVSTAQPQQTVTINPNFPAQISPIPTVPPYRCGAWTSNNAPGIAETITIYARLTHDAQGVANMFAAAVVHFQSGDVALDQTSSDAGGYVMFTLNLQGRQPAQVPATIDVTFTGLQGGPVKCSQAFFTPH